MASDLFMLFQFQLLLADQILTERQDLISASLGLGLILSAIGKGRLQRYIQYSIN